MSHTNNPIHLVIAPTFLTANEDRDAVTFGTRKTTIRWRHRTRKGPGRIRMLPGYDMQGPSAGAADLTTPWVRDFWTGADAR